MRKVFFLGLILFYMANTNASNVGPALPSFIWAQQNGVAFVFFLKNTRTGIAPVCATFGNTSGTYFRYAINLNTVAGRSQFALVLAAHSSGESGYTSGSGACDVASDTETLFEFHTAN